MRTTRTVAARAIPQKQKHLFGAPGAPVMRAVLPDKVTKPFDYYNLVVVPEHWTARRKPRQESGRLHAYLGKHVPYPQKSLWSADAPVPEDKHRFMLTTFDIDTFKYWFGVRRARVDTRLWKILWRAGILPPAYRSFNPYTPRPIFDKEELYRYWLKNRPPVGQMEAERRHQYVYSTPRTAAERAAERPQAPWL